MNDEQTLVGRAVAVHQRPEAGLDLNGNEVAVVAMTLELKLSEVVAVDLGAIYRLVKVTESVPSPLIVERRS